MVILSARYHLRKNLNKIYYPIFFENIVVSIFDYFYINTSKHIYTYYYYQ